MPDLYWKPYPGDPVNEPTVRRRCAFVLDELGRLGWDVSTTDADAPIVVLQRIANPPEVRKHQAHGAKVVFETNDCMLFKDTMFYVPTERETVMIADYVVVTCRYMQKRYGRINPMTLVAPEALEPEFWSTPRPTLPADPLVLSWCGMPDNLQYFEPIVDLIAREFGKKVALRIVMPELDSKRRSNRERVGAWPLPTRFVEWKRETFVVEISRAHAGIVVLPDTEFCRSKAHHKVVGYQALGMPCIASSTPGYREVIRHKETGLLADTDADWVSGIKSLMSVKTRDRIGASAKPFSEHFTKEAVGQCWDRILKGVRDAG